MLHSWRRLFESFRISRPPSPKFWALDPSEPVFQGWYLSHAQPHFNPSRGDWRSSSPTTSKLNSGLSATPPISLAYCIRTSRGWQPCCVARRIHRSILSPSMYAVAPATPPPRLYEQVLILVNHDACPGDPHTANSSGAQSLFPVYRAKLCLHWHMHAVAIPPTLAYSLTRTTFPDDIGKFAPSPPLAIF